MFSLQKYANHLQDSNTSQAHVKEETSSPDLSPAPASLQHFQFKFNPHLDSHAYPPQHRHTPASSTPIPPHIPYRFGHVPQHNYNLMPSGSDPWPSSSSPQIVPSNPQITGPTKYDIETLQSAMTYSDEYDTVSDLADMPLDRHSSIAGVISSSSAANERIIRRRSSKACDQCRKSKCKCERNPGTNEPCKSCMMLGTQCTFLGPSRKRGPPKGYIDAIEARLHQTEALLGIFIASKDSRAQSLLEDVAKDPLAREIINRVDNSPYGVKGRTLEEANKLKSRLGQSAPTSTSNSPIPVAAKSEPLELTSVHPTNEWQDRVSTLLDPSHAETRHEESQILRLHRSHQDLRPSFSSSRPSLRVNPNRQDPNQTAASDDGQSPGRRQRRRIGNVSPSTGFNTYSSSAPGSAVSLHQDLSSGLRGRYTPLSPMNSLSAPNGRDSDDVGYDSMSSGSEEEITGAVGQLSLNEDEQVRYHGKASGLHLLGDKERVDSRNEGGIWRFPKARVWPPLPSGSTAMHGDDIYVSRLPAPDVQELLLELYFTYVHPSFPVVHKRAFFEAYKNSTNSDSPQSPESDVTNTSSNSPFNQRQQRIPTLLLLVMFSLAARYDEAHHPYPTDGAMWGAGDEYLNLAKIILDGTYASSRPSTVQSLLLMGYREIGIGAMAQAWTYTGMAIRMAQDLGMHRSADGWARVGLGGRLFKEWELQERKRVWYACIIMDKYVSAYIGRPLMIFERDFDTLMPSENDLDETEIWPPRTSHIIIDEQEHQALPGRIISCFNASARLSIILSMIVQTIYAVRPASSRHAESSHLEALLDKWYLELPEHLRIPSQPRRNSATQPRDDLSSQDHESDAQTHPPSLPHVLTLHMQYWCAVLLLHRPFIRHFYGSKHKQTEEVDEGEVRAITEKSYELCASAANHITSIVAAYADRYPLSRSSVFLCYYIFTASIMHVTSLTVHPTDPQARVGLARCMEALHSMEIVWPSAARALELLRGSKVNLETNQIAILSTPLYPERAKRSAEHQLDDSSIHAQDHDNSAEINEYLAPPNPTSFVRLTPSGATNSLAARPSSSLDQSYGLYPPFLDHQQTPTAAAPPRWSIEQRAFAGSLSTSVLPELYSTGLDNIRGHMQQIGNAGGSGDGLNMSGGRESMYNVGGNGISMNVNSGRDRHGDGNSGGNIDERRFQPSQFWNVYPAYSQPASTYGVQAGSIATDNPQTALPGQTYFQGQDYNFYDNQNFTSR